MSLIDTILLAVVIGVAVISRTNRSGLVWLAAIAADYYVSGVAWRVGFSVPQLVGGLCDATVCAAILIFGRKIWELRVVCLMLASLLVNILFLTDAVTGADVVPFDVFASILELLTFAAVMTIGATGAFESYGLTSGRSFDTWRTFLGLGLPFRGAVARAKGAREN